MSIPAPAQRRMTADEFIAWAMEQPEGQRYELVAGEIVGMAPERAGHSRTKGLVYRQLQDGLAAANLPCEAFPDGMSVEIDEATVYEPDALVRCGPPLPDEAVKVPDPLIIVEVLSPSTRARDAGAKLADYFKLPSLRHYLIVDTKTRTVIHHRREAEGAEVRTRILRAGAIELDPPGFAVAVEAFFP